MTELHERALGCVGPSGGGWITETSQHTAHHGRAETSIEREWYNEAIQAI